MSKSPRNTPAKAKAASKPQFQVEIVFDDADWPGERNGLLSGDDGRKFYLADIEKLSDDPARCIIKSRGKEIPLSTVKAGDLEAIDLGEACRWFVRCQPFASSMSGDTVGLLSQAAYEL